MSATVSACGDNVIGSDGPRPGIAADVDGSEISLDDLASVVDGVCTLQAASDTAATSRSFAQTFLLEDWVQALVMKEYADDHDLDVTPPPSGLEQAPGWDDIDESDRDALESYVQAAVYASAATKQLGDGDEVDPSDYDISINPKFDLALDGTSWVPAGSQLSVPVSKAGADATAQPSDEEVRALPDDQLCGKRPAAPAPTDALPVPQQQ
ncbi:hypothetical protein [Nocardioides sp. MH1]|uniref:hypothetical protein n=1 Tax=Nocardioides sp. MH1 TaxID=3242490 RepID=UPI00351F8807